MRFCLLILGFPVYPAIPLFLRHPALMALFGSLLGIIEICQDSFDRTLFLPSRSTIPFPLRLIAKRLAVSSVDLMSRSGYFVDDACQKVVVILTSAEFADIVHRLHSLWIVDHSTFGQPALTVELNHFAFPGFFRRTRRLKSK